MSGMGRAEEISTWVTLLLGSREASSSTLSTGSVWVLRKRILVILPLTLRLFRLRLRFFSFTIVADSQLSASCSGVSDEVQEPDDEHRDRQLFQIHAARIISLADFPAMEIPLAVPNVSQVVTNQSIAATKIAAIRNTLVYTNAFWICARFAAFA
jgi:hypothetical protein